MSLLGDLLLLFLKFMKSFYKKLGYNAILLVILLIELPLLYLYYSDESIMYRVEKRYEIQRICSIKPIAWNDERIKQSNIHARKGDKYYVVMVEIQNKYCDPLHYISLYAKNQDDRDFICDFLTYSDDSKNSGYESDSIIPAGVTKAVPYVISIDVGDLKNTKSITLYEWTSDKDKAKEVTMEVGNQLQ
ncbi:hypothetical protein lbkm_1758 [Lachnospiraceae bacterium KM106-2]|nr:hypothetical protein lbkm_1758 [Lachnospiraceae bacterium KM106-2]